MNVNNEYSTSIVTVTESTQSSAAGAKAAVDFSTQEGTQSNITVTESQSIAAREQEKEKKKEEDGIIQSMEIKMSHKDEEPTDDNHCTISKYVTYKHIEKITSLLIIILGIGAFSVPIYQCITTGQWISNPFNTDYDPIPYFNTVTIHVLIALFWSLCLPLQLISGLYVRDVKNNDVITIKLDINKYKKYKKFHKIFGQKFAPIALIIYVVLAYILIGLRWNVLDTGFIFVNVNAGIGMICVFVLGMYYIYIKKDIDRHRDCMMNCILFSFLPALNRIVLYIFYLIHYIIFGNINFHPDTNLLVVFGGALAVLIVIPLHYKRLRKWWNFPVLIGSLIAMVLFSLLSSGIL